MILFNHVYRDGMRVQADPAIWDSRRISASFPASPWHPDELESWPKMPTKRTTHLIYDDLKTSNSGFQHVQKHIHYII